RDCLLVRVPSFPTRRSSDLSLPLGELGGPREGLRALRAVLGARRLAVPQRDALVVLSGDREEAIELVDERRVLEVDRERALDVRSEEHTSELQSRENLVCRL